ncbi:MAG: primosomal protein N' family DNA-binding protein, partial [Acidimicrobiales bacterium]
MDPVPRAVRVVRVVADIPAIHRRFDYAVPEAMDPTIKVGSRVRVDLHGRRVGAWVVEDDVDPPSGVTVKPIARSSGEGPPCGVVELAEWAAWRWAGPMSSGRGPAAPPRGVRPPGGPTR